MALPQNRRAVKAILRELEPRVIGKTHPGFTCGCGAIHCEPATAVAIEPSGDGYPGQEVKWYLWTVRMSAHPENGNLVGDWSCGLSEFVPSEELDELFDLYFKGAEDDYPYRLAVHGEDRLYQNLPAAVRIPDNDVQIRFCIDWGADQAAAEQLERVCRANPGRIPAGSDTFNTIVGILRTLQPEVEVYRGGPNPDILSRISASLIRLFPILGRKGILRPLEESVWRMDYEKALNEATRVADHIFFQNGGRHSDWRGSVITGQDIVFMKVPVKD